MRKTTIIILMALIAPLLHAQDYKVLADSAFAQENYKTAADNYLRLTRQGVNADVYYNLGCCYYRMDEIARSILWFERAAMLSPADEDIQFNLDMARSKTVDRITPRHEMFFVSAWHSFSNIMSIDTWAKVSLFIFFFSLALLALYIFSSAVLVRKCGFFGSILCLLLVIVFNLCAYTQRVNIEERSSAIIMTPAVTIKSTPSQSGADLFVLHEGTHVEILDNTMKEWVEIQIADGKVGWMPRNLMEII